MQCFTVFLHCVYSVLYIKSLSFTVCCIVLAVCSTVGFTNVQCFTIVPLFTVFYSVLCRAHYTFAMFCIVV